MAENKRRDRIENFSQFWPFFLEQHSKPLTRNFHLVGGLLGGTLVITGFIRGAGLLVLIGVAIGYALAWFSHLFIEQNKPATFRYPIWSLVAEMKMNWLMFTKSFSTQNIEKPKTIGRQPL